MAALFSAKQPDDAAAAEVPTAPWGRLFTFYSYKGGVGRSMALANVAACLSKWGHRVLVVDWDLEAPGLEKFYTRWLKGLRTRTPGILDLLLAKAEGRELSWRSCLMHAAVFDHTPAIDVISAGQLTKEYAERVQRLDWKHLFEERDLGAYLDRLRNEWGNAYDFVLVDSRTGINDVGGICTVLIPDVVVLLFTTSEQSVDGVVDVMKQAQALHRQLPTERGRLLALPMPSRDESRKFKDQTDRWRKKYAEVLGEFYAAWAPRGVSAESIINRLYIPYYGEFSFGEQLPVVEAPSQFEDPTSIGYAYARLATLIANKLDWDAVLGRGEGSEAADARAKLADVEARLVKGKRRGNLAAAIVLLLIGVMVVVGQLSSRQRERRARARTILAAISTTSDPLLATLLAAELQGLPDPGTGVSTLQGVAGSPIPRIAFGGPGPTSQVHISGDGRHVAVVNAELATVALYRTDGRGDPAALPGPAFLFLPSAVFSPDGSQLLTISDSTARIWPVDSLHTTFVTLAGSGRVVHAGFSSDGRYLFTQSARGDLDLWWLGFSGPVSRLRLRGVSTAAFSGDGSRIVVGFASGAVEVRTAAGPRLLASYEGPSSRVLAIATDERGSWVLAVYGTEVLLLGSRMTSLGRLDLRGSRWAFAGGRLLTITDSLVRVSRPLFADTGLNTPRVWSAETLGLVTEAGVAGLSDDGSTAFAIESNLARIWRAGDSGLRFGSALPIPLHGPGVSGALNRDGSFLATYDDNTVKVWPTSVLNVPQDWQGLIQYLRSATTACLFADNRVRLLGESEEAARTAYEQCERGFGRTPGRAAALVDSLQRTRPRTN